MAGRVAGLGGEVAEKPFDILDVGRMAAVMDPTGTGVAIWQPGTYAGAGRVNEPGFLTWNELATNDTSAALRFYEGLFGWSSEAMDTGGGPEYTVIKVGERSNGGVRRLSAEEEQAGLEPYWVPYFAVESLDTAFERCADLGGEKLFGPMAMPRREDRRAARPAGRDVLDLGRRTRRLARPWPAIAPARCRRRAS